MATFRNIKFYSDNALNMRIAQSLTGDIDTATNSVATPIQEIVSFDDFPTRGRILMRVEALLNPDASTTQCYIPNITALRTGGDPNKDRNIIDPQSALSLGNSKIALIRTFNHSDLLSTDELSVTVDTSADTITCADRSFTDGELVYFTSGTLPSGVVNTQIYTVSAASGTTCELLAFDSATKVNFTTAGTSPKIRIFNTNSQSLKLVRLAPSATPNRIQSYRASTIAADNTVVVLLGDSIKAYLPQSSSLALPVFGTGELQNVREYNRYKVSGYVDASPDYFNINNLESSTPRSFSLTSATMALVANIGTSITYTQIKIRHTQQFAQDFPLGGHKQVNPNQIVTQRVNILPKYAWFLIDLFDNLDGDYRYTIEFNPSLQEMLLFTDNVSNTER